jgi:hypothetical protein
VNEVTNLQARAAQQYAFELIERLDIFPSTHEQLVAMVAVAYLEGGAAQLAWAIERMSGDEARTAERLAQLRAVQS